MKTAHSAPGRPEDREIKRWLEAHERRFFDDATTTQVLRRLIVVCSDCHRTTHVGYAQVKGEERQAFDHLVAVTGMTADQARAHLDNAFATWRRAGPPATGTST
ncbi:hypothetical protein [Actinophytocola sp. KF-1]